MDNFIQEGEVLEWTNTTTSDVASGDVVVIGDRIGVAVADIDVDDAGSLCVEGVFELDALTAATWDQGDVLYWHQTNLELTNIASANVVAGYAAAAKAALATVAKVKINC